MALGADRNFAVVADAHTVSLAPDVGPPGTLGRRTDDRAFCGDGLVVGLVRGGPEFAVDFVLVGVRDELVQELVGSTSSRMRSAARTGTRRFCLWLAEGA